MSRLLNNSDQYRDPLLAKNNFTNNDEYNVANSRAISDGDDFGKGENNGSIGSVTDIGKREELKAKNTYTQSNEYNISNA
jgi:hypothetical protein